MKFSFLIFSVVICLIISNSSARLFPKITDKLNAPVPGESGSKVDAIKFENCRLGDKVEGLAKLKNRLNHFGYISNHPNNFTNHFDAELESALKTYQINFNLKVTGELDDQTINHLVRPRSGNPDIINGTTTMNSGRPVPFPDSKLHTVGHYSFLPGTPVWPKDRQTFAFLPENELSDQKKAVFINAFKRWSKVIPMTFTETTSYDSADIKIGFFVGDHGDGDINAFDGFPGPILAHSSSFPIGTIDLDKEEHWDFGGDITDSTEYAVDVEYTVIHEIGHVLGLGHSSLVNSVMYPYIDYGTKMVDLSNDDIQGIQSLYGANPSNDGTGTSSGQAPAAKTLGLVVGVVLAVGSVLLSF